jgi:hypothetical protein
MVLSKRERYIGIATGVVLGLVVLLKLIIFPLDDSRKELNDKVSQAKADLAQVDQKVKNAEGARRNWNNMAGNHLRRDESEAESSMYTAIRDWASESQLPLASVKPERAPEKEKDFYKLTFRATANGGMGQIGRFLYHVQTANMPVRVTDLSISSRKEGVDDLTLSVALATIYPASDTNRNGSNGNNTTPSVAMEGQP